jgi:hypothetical protein
MNKSYDYIDLIDLYLRNRLNTAEKEEFEKLIQEDPEFEKLFFEMDQLVAGIRFSAAKSTVEEKLARLEEFMPVVNPALIKSKTSTGIISTLTEYANELMNNLSLRLSLTSYQFKLALSGVSAAVIFTFTILFNLFRTPGPDVLFVEFFEPPMYEDFGTRGSGDDLPDPVTVKFNEAMIRYNHRDYASASQIISSIPAESLDFNMKLYYALVNMKLGNLGAAKNILVPLMEKSNANNANNAKWYLALCYVKDKKYNEAESLLEEVKAYGSEHVSQAEKLLNKIK